MSFIKNVPAFSFSILFITNPAFESKHHTRAPDTSYRHSQCLYLLIYKMTVLLLVQLKGALRDLPAAWLSSPGRSPSAGARQAAHTHHSSPSRALPYEMSWHNGRPTVFEVGFFLMLQFTNINLNYTYSTGLQTF